MKPYYDEAGITIYHAPCEEVLPEVSGVDLVFTSPPYNLGWASDSCHHQRVRVGHGGSKWTGAAIADGYVGTDDALPPAEYAARQSLAIALMWATLSDTGAIFYVHKPRVTDKQLWTPLALVPATVPVRQVLMWARAGGINYGRSHYVSTHEWIVVMAREGFTLRDQSASGVGDVWRVAQESNPDHPAPFPLTLPATAIQTTTPSLVLDPFLGSGTTLRAAKDAGVRGIGIEKSERYCEIAAKRLAQEVLPLGEVETNPP